MPVAAFDTLKYAKQLKLAGVSEEQAEAQSAALAEALQTGIQNLVTTTEFRAESGSIRQEMRSLSARFSTATL